MQAVDVERDQRFWNHTPFRSYLFNGFSLLLPFGEQFVIQSMEDAAVHLSSDDPLGPAVAQFVQEERAHQRAHRLYNSQLASQGYDVQALEARIGRAIRGLEAALDWRERLALAAALEYLTALISRYSLKGQGWLVNDDSRQASMWRWHCAEEVKHHGVALQLLLQVGRVGYARRMTLYVLASLVLFWDVTRHIWSFFRTDRLQGRLSWRDGVASWLGFVASRGACLARMSGAWLAYALPLRSLAETRARESWAGSGIEVRLLKVADIPRLLILEQLKWSNDQAANASAMERRIRANPELCIGAFAGESGEVLASLFLKPISDEQIYEAQTWADCSDTRSVSEKRPCRDLFGISLSSVDAEAVDQIFEYFWPLALKGGWRHIYLGSPVPGLARWRLQKPLESVENYIYASRAGLPRDPQLRYYWKKGFKTIVTYKSGYFPHAASLDYGVVIRGQIPLAQWSILWRVLPLRWLQRISRHLFKLL